MNQNYSLKILTIISLFYFSQAINTTNDLDLVETNRTILSQHNGSRILDGCISCFPSNFMACFDGNCYCQTNYYWNQNHQRCEFLRCSTNYECEVPQDPNRYCNNGWCYCLQDYYEDPNNGHKCTQRSTPSTSTSTPSTTIATTQTESPQESTTDQDPFVVYNNCSKNICLYFNHLVCVDQKCYCAPNYQWDPRNKDCWYTNCGSDADCYQSHDIKRRCVPPGNCVCDINYVEDWNNGRKCTFKLSIWYWVWIFILLPVVGLGVGIWLCIRARKRVNQGHSINSSQVQPPSYGSDFDPNRYRNGVPIRT